MHLLWRLCQLAYLVKLLDETLDKKQPHIHDLKVTPRYFNLVSKGLKTHDVRRCDDRHFKVGDLITYREYDSENGYSGREVTVQITFIEKPRAFNTSEFASIMSISLIKLIKG